MPSTPTIDIDALLQPVPGDDPAGGPLPSEPIRKKLDDFREEFDPSDLDPSDPRRNDPSVEKKSANWQAVIDLSEETLKETSKSLLVTVRLTEALTMQRGLTGVRDGLRLLRRMAEECWDRMQPKIEEPDDVEIRAGMYNWLDDPIRGALFPNKLRAVPILQNGSAPISFITCRPQGNDKVPQVGSDQVSAAARAADPVVVQHLLEDVAEAIDEVTLLGKILDEKMPGDIAPSFADVRKALEDCQTIAKWVRQENGGGSGGETSTDDVAAVGGGGGVAIASGALTRDAAYEQLKRVAEMLERMEPHSPVPYLIRRAVELRAIKFPDLVEELTKDSNVLAFLKREINATEGG
jgi:type VI secretion system protein ImpA